MDRITKYKLYQNKCSMEITPVCNFREYVLHIDFTQFSFYTPLAVP